MKLTDVRKIGSVNLELLAKQIVEGFISGMHKSPFHGFSVEFSEHKLYNTGESTRHVDWKLYAKTDKLYTKKYEEETNLRCHIVVDNSASMHYPDSNNKKFDALNKVGFSAYAAAALIEILKRQRDAVGLSVYSDGYDFYAPEKGNERHRKLLYNELARVLESNSTAATNTYTYLHNIANKIHRRSLIFLFTDLFQTDVKQQELFDALRHLKFNKHELVLFHTYDGQKEFNFDFDNSPKKFVDVPEELQVSRTMKRDNNSREQVEAILAAQLKRQDRLPKASHILYNDQDLLHLYRQVDALHEELIKN